MAVTLGDAVLPGRVIPAARMGAVDGWLGLDEWLAAERTRALAAMEAELQALRAEREQALEDELHALREQAQAAREAERVLAAAWLRQQARDLAQAMAGAAAAAFADAVLDDPDALAAFHAHVLARALAPLDGAARITLEVAPQAEAAVRSALAAHGLEPGRDVDLALLPALAPGVVAVQAGGALFECDLPGWLATLSANWAEDAWRAWSAAGAEEAPDGLDAGDEGFDDPGFDDPDLDDDVEGDDDTAQWDEDTAPDDEVTA